MISFLFLVAGTWFGPAALALCICRSFPLASLASVTLATSESSVAWFLVDLLLGHWTLLSPAEQKLITSTLKDSLVLDWLYTTAQQKHHDDNIINVAALG